MGCSKCKSRADRLRAEGVKKLVDKGMSKKEAETQLPKNVTHNMLWAQMMGVTLFVFAFGWVMTETFIFIFTYLYNLIF
tara:strand:- start:7320 stop:7556 length:237 start_codon:yes stop_codon:yes gene_type:complete